MPSPTPITNFLYKLEVDDEFVKDFLANRKAVAERAGLSSDAVEAFVNNDLAKLQELVNSEQPDPVEVLPRGWIR